MIDVNGTPALRAPADAVARNTTSGRMPRYPKLLQLPSA
jgi:hypothetical protein